MTISPRAALLTVFFIGCLWPYSIALGGQGISANYSYVLLPVLYAIVRGTARRPPDGYFLIMGMFSAIFVVASMYQFGYLEHFTRRVASFVLFMTMFSYMFIRMDPEMVGAFKRAIVTISVYFSAVKLMTYLEAGSATLGAKYLIGSQRFGFIYLLAIWLVYQEQESRRLWKVMKYPTLFLLLLGLLLTFSRSGIVGMLGSFGLFAFLNLIHWIRRANLAAVRRGIASVVIVGALVFAVIDMLPGAAVFFEQRLFGFFLDAPAVIESLATTESSEGFRIYMFGQILDFVWHHPLTGSGYLGVWILSGDLSGSAHSQYLDVLFRTGLVGFVLYMYLTARLVRFLYVNERPLFWGIIGVLIYGTVHETFKESQGAFVFAFLLGMMSQRRTALRVSTSG